MKNEQKNLSNLIFKYDFIISLIIIVFIYFLFNANITSIFSEKKDELLNMIISLSGTLFGFILTFLSIFIIFKTEKKYEKDDTNKNNPLILFVNNMTFNNIYTLFINASYSLGLLIVISLLFYFTSYGLSFYINTIFIYVLIYLIVLSIIRVILSLVLFNFLIKILVSKKNV